MLLLHSQRRLSGPLRRLSFLKESYALDYRSLAVFRVLVGLVVFIDLLSRLPHSTVLYSDAGVYPRTLAMGLINPDRWSVYFLSGTPEFVRFVFIVGLIAAFFMIIGWRTRTATIVLWIVVLSLQARNNHANSGADTLMRMTLFWGMFLPLGARWSVDSHRERTRLGTSSEVRSSVANLVGFGLILQGACLYFFSALLKDGPRWHEEANAVYYAVGIGDISNPIGDWLFHHAPAWFFQIASVGALWLEFTVPLMLLLPVRNGWLRTLGVFLIIALHLGIASMMWVGLFGSISIASISGVLPTSFWRFVSARFRVPAPVMALRDRTRLFANQLVEPAPEYVSPVTPSVTADQQHVLRFHHSWRPAPGTGSELMLNVVGAVSIVLMLAWNISTVSAYQPPEPISRLAMVTGVFQQWSMFAPNPQGGTLWFVIEGELASGEKVDLMTPIVAQDVSIHQPVVWDQSEGHVVTDKYWRKYFEAIQLREGDSRAFAEYTCRTWNSYNTGEDRLVSFRIFRGFATTLPGSERADPMFDQVSLWNCG